MDEEKDMKLIDQLFLIDCIELLLDIAKSQDKVLYNISEGQGIWFPGNKEVIDKIDKKMEIIRQRIGVANKIILSPTDEKND